MGNEDISSEASSFPASILVIKVSFSRLLVLQLHTLSRSWETSWQE